MNNETEDCQPIPTLLLKSHCLYPLNLIKTSISLLIDNERMNFQPVNIDFILQILWCHTEQLNISVCIARIERICSYVDNFGLLI